MRPVLTLPDSRLRQKSERVTRFDGVLRELCDELTAAMRAGPGGVGIAAPQVGELKRVVIVDCSVSRRPCKNHGLLRMVNPEIVEGSTQKVLGREGCLSVPEWVGMVSRSREVRVRFHDVAGVEREIACGGFEARVVQHEVDHLDGILFIDHIVSIQDLVRRMQ
ncbi:MAG TPA: peptide deformylase [Mariprofundaceae bacterium]|nr:peptide deformylase [Mariprofundaceae bacterium]